MKIVVLDEGIINQGDISWDALRDMGELTVYNYTPEEEVINRIGDAEVVFINRTPLRGAVFNECKSLKYVGIFATGYNVIDVKAARANGVTVANVPAYGTDAVAQLAAALLLEICHHVWMYSENVRSGGWEENTDFYFGGHALIELRSKTLGIIGFGNIGRKFAQIANALGMDVLAYSRTALAEKNGPCNFCEGKNIGETARIKFVTLDEIFASSDVISLHVPLFDSTRGMINKDSIQKMKEGVILINTARGPLIVEEDLADALNCGKVGYAAVDVVSREPIRGDNPLMFAKNCIITPHMAWAPRETRVRLMKIAFDNLRKFLDGAPVNVVN